MNLAFFSSARMILLECHESPAKQDPMRNLQGVAVSIQVGTNSVMTRVLVFNAKVRKNEQLK